MKAYKGTFKKKDGSSREMFFARIKDMPEEFISKKILGTGVQKTYADSSEIVWDIESDGFRVFNWATAEGPVVAVKVDESYFT